MVCWVEIVVDGNVLQEHFLPVNDLPGFWMISSATELSPWPGDEMRTPAAQIRKNIVTNL
jgi:hypothetical protein